MKNKVLVSFGMLMFVEVIVAILLLGLMFRLDLASIWIIYFTFPFIILVIATAWLGYVMYRVDRWLQ